MEIPTLEALTELEALVNDSPELYVRYSRDWDHDREGRSLDTESGIELPGLSVNPLAPELWWSRPPADWLARQLCQYKHLGEKNPERVAWVTGGRTPWVSMAASTAVAMALTLTGGPATLAQPWSCCCFSSSSAPTLRFWLRKDHVEQEHFRAPTVLPVAALASCVLLLTQQGPETWLRGGVLLAIGGARYLLTRMGAGSRTTVNHDNVRAEGRSGNSASDAAPRTVDDIEPH